MSIEEYLNQNYNSVSWDNDIKTIVLDGEVVSGDLMNDLAGKVKQECGYEKISEKDVIKAIKNCVKNLDKKQPSKVVNIPDWMNGMDLTNDGYVKDSANNNRILFEQFPGFKGKFIYNKCENTEMYDGRPLTDVVLSELKCQVEGLLMGNRAPGNIKSAALVVCRNHAINPVEVKLNELRGCWDGEKRLEGLFIKAFECDDCQYIREVTRQLFYAAYHRMIDPGCIFNMIFMFEGKQGIGKSELLKRMFKLIDANVVDGMKFNNDRSTLEKMSKNHLYIFDELGNMSKADLEFIKEFISRSSDTYDEKYRSTETKPRPGVLIGNLNPDRKHFLKDVTLNFERRFIIIPCHAKGTAEMPVKSESWWWNQFLPDEYLIQVWAELVWMIENEPNFQWMGWTQDRIDAAIEIQKDYSSLDNDDILINMLDEILNYKYPVSAYYMFDTYKYDLNNIRSNNQYGVESSGVEMDKIKCGVLRQYIKNEMREDRSFEYFTAVMKKLGWEKKKVSVWVKGKKKNTTVDAYVRMKGSTQGTRDYPNIDLDSNM